MDSLVRWREYSPETRKNVMNKFNLSQQQCDLLVKAYDDISMIGGLLYRSDVEKSDIRYWNPDLKAYFPLPRLMRQIVAKTPKDRFANFFSPFRFPDFFERFVYSILSDKTISNGADFLGTGLICYVKQKGYEPVIEREFAS